MLSYDRKTSILDEPLGVMHTRAGWRVYSELDFRTVCLCPDSATARALAEHLTKHGPAKAEDLEAARDEAKELRAKLREYVGGML